MTWLAVGLITLSAVIHAAWNLLSKQAHPTPAYFFLSGLVGVLCLSPYLAYHRDLLPMVPPAVWGLVIITGACQALYYCSLAAAYRHGALSLVYPLARAIPVLLVLGAAFVLNRAEQIGLSASLGFLLVVLGMFLLPKKTFTAWRIRDYLTWPCLFALLAAVGTAGYSLLDDEALRRLRLHLGGSMAVGPLALFYLTLEGMSTSVFMATRVALGRRGEIGRLLRTSKLSIAVTGISIYLCYALVLASMAMVDDVSYVVGFRQIGILLGVLAGIWILKEPRYPPKLAGAAVLLAGLLLIAVG